MEGGRAGQADLMSWHAEHRGKSLHAKENINVKHLKGDSSLNIYLEITPKGVSRRQLGTSKGRTKQETSPKLLQQRRTRTQDQCGEEA